MLSQQQQQMRERDGLDAPWQRRRCWGVRAAGTAALTAVTLALWHAGAIGLEQHESLALGLGVDPGASTRLGVATAIRTFRYFSVEQAEQVLLTNLNITEHADLLPPHLPRELTDMMNAAIRRIRHALLTVGYLEQELPFVSRTPPAPTTRQRGHDEAELVDVARKWLAVDAHPDIWKLAVTGGVCSGKTTCTRAVRATVDRTNGTLITVTVPEVATMLFKLGAMSYGSFAGYEAAENWEFVLHTELLQLALEELLSQGADSILKARRPVARHVIMLTDRDALDNKAYTLPITPRASFTWSAVVTELGRRLGRPAFTEADMAQRYQLGVVILQSVAVVNGSLSHGLYDKYCAGPTSSNTHRAETTEEAVENDERVNRAYVEVYPRWKRCRLSNDGAVGTNLGKKQKAFVACVRRQIDRQHGSRRQ